MESRVKRLTDLYSRQSDHWSTPVSNSMTKPSMAATTAGTPRLSPRIQRMTARSIVMAMIVSSRVRRPIFCSFSSACLGASGVSLISGFTICTECAASWSLQVETDASLAETYSGPMQRNLLMLCKTPLTFFRDHYGNLVASATE